MQLKRLHTMPCGSPFISKYGGWRGRTSSREKVKEENERMQERERERERRNEALIRFVTLTR